MNSTGRAERPPARRVSLFVDRLGDERDALAIGHGRFHLHLLSGEHNRIDADTELVMRSGPVDHGLARQHSLDFVEERLVALERAVLIGDPADDGAVGPEAVRGGGQARHGCIACFVVSVDGFDRLYGIVDDGRRGHGWLPESHHGMDVIGIRRIGCGGRMISSWNAITSDTRAAATFGSVVSVVFRRPLDDSAQAYWAAIDGSTGGFSRSLSRPA